MFCIPSFFRCSSGDPTRLMAIQSHLLLAAAAVHILIMTGCCSSDKRERELLRGRDRERARERKRERERTCTAWVTERAENRINNPTAEGTDDTGDGKWNRESTAETIKFNETLCNAKESQNHTTLLGHFNAHVFPYSVNALRSGKWKREKQFTKRNLHNHPCALKWLPRVAFVCQQRRVEKYMVLFFSFVRFTLSRFQFPSPVVQCKGSQNLGISTLQSQNSTAKAMALGNGDDPGQRQ